MQAIVQNLTAAPIPVEEDSLTSWVGALQEALADRGYTVQNLRQHSHDEALLGYMADVLCEGKQLQLKCAIYAEPQLCMRIDVQNSASMDRVMNYRLNLGGTDDVLLVELAQKLASARNRIPLIAEFLDKANTTGSLLH